MKVPQFVEKQYKTGIFHNFYACIFLKSEQSIMHEISFVHTLWNTENQTRKRTYFSILENQGIKQKRFL